MLQQSLCVFVLCIAEEMEAFSERSVDTYFEFSILQFFIVLLLCTLIGVAFGATLHWSVGLGVGAGLFCLLYAILGKCQPLVIGAVERLVILIVR